MYIFYVHIAYIGYITCEKAKIKGGTHNRILENSKKQPVDDPDSGTSRQRL